MIKYTPRELLTLAAKALGLTVSHWNDGTEPYSSGEGFILPSGKLWNPLTSNGDAFSLAIALKLRQDHGSRWSSMRSSSMLITSCVPHGDDPESAARRAIVNVAAEIGRNIQGI